MWANALGERATRRFWARELGPLDLHHWVNDGLMALFFFVVGLEIKRELVAGELRDRRAAALPAIAAVGGVALPIAIFVAADRGRRRAPAGWAIPAATDIAFAVGVLALLGDRVSAGARLFLLSVAIVDDIIAITIIAIFYAGEVSFALAGGRGRCSPSRSASTRWAPGVRPARDRALDRRPRGRACTRRSPASCSGC